MLTWKHYRYVTWGEQNHPVQHAAFFPSVSRDLRKQDFESLNHSLHGFELVAPFCSISWRTRLIIELMNDLSLLPPVLRDPYAKTSMVSEPVEVVLCSAAPAAYLNGASRRLQASEGVICITASGGGKENSIRIPAKNFFPFILACPSSPKLARA